MMDEKIRIYTLAIKYWLQGDDWSSAVEYAMAIVRGFKTQSMWLIRLQLGGNMKCPYCGRDLLSLTWKYWSGLGDESFELICPECGNSVVVVASLNFDIRKLEDNQ